MRYLVTLIATGLIIYIIYILQTKNGFNLKEIFFRTSINAGKLVGDKLYKLHERNIITATIHNKKTFSSSKLYKTLQSMIFNLNWDGTVEAYIFIVCSLSIIINVILRFLFFKSIVLFIFGSILGVGIIHIYLYVLSTSYYFKREYAIMATMDLIIVNLENGVYQAIYKQQDRFPEEVAPQIKSFIENINVYQQTTIEALNGLSKELGTSFQRFSDKVKEYEIHGRKGMLETFQEELIENTMKRDLMRRTQDLLFSFNITFFICIAINVILGILVILSSETLVTFMLETVLGKLVILINVAFLTGVYAFVQTLRKGGEG